MASVTVTSENLKEFTENNGKLLPKVNDPADDKKEVETKDPDEEQEGKKSKKGNLPARFSEITSERNEARREAEAARKEASELKARLEALERGSKPTEQPKPESYTDPVKYAEALADWKFDEKEKARKEKETKDREQEEREKVTRAWNKQWTKISREYEDFDEVTKETIDFRQDTVRDAIYESDIGPRLAYYFSKNREELDKINDMTVKPALKFLGRIEAKIEAELERAKEKEETKEEKASVIPRRQVKEPPEPITPVKGIGATTTANVNQDGVVTNDKAFRTEMRKQLYGH